ncbi:MAG: hypothetical protein GY832_05625 [Chloroflexi bacterium]|nr:hypothetical protein [Chloroflexota bacterium]
MQRRLIVHPGFPIDESARIEGGQVNVDSLLLVGDGVANSAPLPSPPGLPQVVHCPVFPWAGGGGMRGGEGSVDGVVCGHKRVFDHCYRVGLVVVSAGLWVMVLAPAPVFATAETEDRFLGLHRFLPVQNLVMNLGPQIATGTIDLNCLIASTTDVPQSAPSPSPPSLARWSVDLFPLGRGGGMRGGGGR